jgi:hypothetical protein
MEFRNFTPFPGLAYQSLDQYNSLYHTVALRQTMKILGDGSLIYPEEQEPLVVADEYFGEINQSSVRCESDLAPFKPKCDVLVVATAFAPSGAARRFSVSLRISSPVGDIPHVFGTGEKRTPGEVILDKTLSITGTRFWLRSIFANWELTDPDIISSLPVRYEYAYGGELKLHDQAGEKQALLDGRPPETVPLLRHTAVDTNPVGRGYVEDWLPDFARGGPISAPQIEDPNNPVRSIHVRYPAEGFGVITRAWLPRRSHCGTIDDAFAKSDKWLPEDFDFAYWNGAHPDLQLPYLQGDEVIELTNLSAGGYLRLELPGDHPYVLVRFEEGAIIPAPLHLDTLLIDTDRMQVNIVHRLLIAVQPKIRVLEARLLTKSQCAAAAGLLSSEEAPIGR